MRYNLYQSEDGTYSMTSALRVGGTRKPRQHCIALTDCVCTLPDGTTRIIPRRRTVAAAKRAIRATIAPPPPHRTMAKDLPAPMAD